MSGKCLLVVSLEGNIGAGKSTALHGIMKRLSKLERVAFVPEPADAWLKAGFLQEMYAGNIEKCSFQHMILTSLTACLLEELVKDRPPLLIITERSPHSNFHVFAKAVLRGRPLDLYEHSWKDVIRMVQGRVAIRHVVLETEPRQLFERIRQRNRECESQITLDYLQTIRARHDEWIANGSDESFSRVSCADDVETAIDNICTAISNFLQPVMDKASDQDDRDYIQAMRVLLDAKKVPDGNIALQTV